MLCFEKCSTLQAQERWKPIAVAAAAVEKFDSAEIDIAEAAQSDRSFVHGAPAAADKNYGTAKQSCPSSTDYNWIAVGIVAGEAAIVVESGRNQRAEE